MSQQRLKRIQALERHQPRGKPWVDISDWAIPHLLAVLEGRPYSVLPKPDLERTDEQETAYRCTMAESIASERLEAEAPGAAERTQAERERRLTANLRQHEKEQAEREAASYCSSRYSAPPP